MHFGWHILSLHASPLSVSLLSLSSRGSDLPCGKGPLLCLTCDLWPLECTMVHPHKASTYPPGRFAASQFLWEGRRHSCPSPWPGLSFLHFPRPVAQLFRLHQGKASLRRMLLLSHWNISELAEQLCGSPHFPLFKAFSLTFYSRDKVWLVSQCVPVRREATAKARRFAPFLAWLLVRWGWSAAPVFIPTLHACRFSLSTIVCNRRSYCLASACNPYQAAFQWGWETSQQHCRELCEPGTLINLETKLTSKGFCCCVWCI